MNCSIEARVVAIDAAHVFVVARQRIASFRRETLPPEWWRKLRWTAVNDSVAALIVQGGVPAATPFGLVPLLRWPAESADR